MNLASHRDHSPQFESNEHQNAHILAVLNKLTSTHGNLGWVLRRMTYPRLCLMNTLIDGYDDESHRMVLLALKNELNGTTFRSPEMIFARTVTAPITAFLLQGHWITEDQIATEVRKCLPNPTLVTPVPAKCDDSRTILRHFASQRGALIQHMVCGERPPPPSLDHLIWLGERYESILPIMRKLEERRTTDAVLVNELMQSGAVLAEGVL